MQRQFVVLSFKVKFGRLAFQKKKPKQSMVLGYLNFSVLKLRYSRKTENTNSTRKALWEMLYNTNMMTGVFETLA